MWLRRTLAVVEELPMGKQGGGSFRAGCPAWTPPDMDFSADCIIRIFFHVGILISFLKRL